MSKKYNTPKPKQLTQVIDDYDQDDDYIEDDEEIYIYYQGEQLPIKLKYAELAPEHNLQKVREVLAERGFEDLNYRFVRKDKKKGKRVHVQLDQESKQAVAKVRNILNGQSRL